MVAIANGERRKDLTMPIIENTAQIPDVPDDFHLLEIEDVETTEGTKYGDPNIPETRFRNIRCAVFRSLDRLHLFDFQHVEISRDIGDLSGVFDDRHC